MDFSSSQDAPATTHSQPVSMLVLQKGMNLGWTKSMDEPALGLQLGSFNEPLKGGPSTKTGKVR